MEERKETAVVLKTPDLESSALSMKRGFRDHKFIFIVGICSVKYRGRADSKLKDGERVVIIKGDCSVLVHRPRNYSPINWQPPGSLLSVSIEKEEERNKDKQIKTKRITEKRLVIKAVRQRPMEILEIFFKKIFYLGMFDLVDEGQFSLYASEEDIQKSILIDPEIIESGFQVISYEKRVDPGFIDIYGIDVQDRLVVIEIKRKTAGKTAILQLEKYLKAVKETTNKVVRGVIAAPSIARGTQLLLATLGIEFKRLDLKKCAEMLKEKEKKRYLDFYIH